MRSNTFTRWMHQLGRRPAAAVAGRASPPHPQAPGSTAPSPQLPPPSIAELAMLAAIVFDAAC
jgi:hypothetical protein